MGVNVMTLEGVPSEGCSKPRSLIARRSSGFRRKSLQNCETTEIKRVRVAYLKPVE